MREWLARAPRAPRGAPPAEGTRVALAGGQLPGVAADAQVTGARLQRGLFSLGPER